MRLKIDGEGARVAESLDVIAGTGTGFVLAAILGIPEEEERPLFKAKVIVHGEQHQDLLTNQVTFRAFIYFFLIAVD